MIESEMGDLQDAIALSGMVPQSCVPTFGEIEEWSDAEVEDVRAWIAARGAGPTPVVFHAAIAKYHAPRPPSESYTTAASEHADMMGGVNFVDPGRDWT